MGGRAAILYTLRNNYRSPGEDSIGRSDVSKLNQREGGTVDQVGILRRATYIDGFILPSVPGSKSSRGQKYFVGLCQSSQVLWMCRFLC